MVDLPKEFLSRMRKQLKDGYTEFLKSYERSAERGLRVNTLKISVDNFLKISPFKLQSVPWENSGFYAAGEGLGKTVYHAAGLYYVQEPSAMSAVPQLNVKKGERVLDLCSAPGGKGTQIAQYMQGEGILFLNEINFSRAKILSSNVERLGIKNAVVTCASPERAAEEFKNYFDKILVDAPCSGEGMFKKEESAIPEWSTENVKRCAARQGEILECAYRMLAGGGRMVYSTCTFAPEEDEEQIENFINLHPDCKLLKESKLLPHEIRGEGHFYAVIEKSEGERADVNLVVACVKDKKMLSLYRQWESENLNITLKNVYAVGQTLYCIPSEMPKISLQTLRAGIRLGEIMGSRFEPDHSLAMSLKDGEAESIPVDEKTALNYLRGLTFECSPSLKGWRLVTFKSYPLGWCKISGGVAKNHLPKGVRI